MQDMDRMLAKGEIPEEEMKALEMDVTGKIMLASWRGTRFEVVQVLREVSLRSFINCACSLILSSLGGGQRTKGPFGIRSSPLQSGKGTTGLKYIWLT